MKLSAIALVPLTGTAGILAGLSWWWLGSATAIASVVAVGMNRCRHPYPALQPAMRDDGGELQPARWYCHDCGRSWAAIFERETTPVLRYSGFEQEKAIEAARRADELDARRRALAVDRAGLPNLRSASGPVGIARTASRGR